MLSRELDGRTVHVKVGELLRGRRRLDDDNDNSASTKSPKPISFASQRARKQLVEDGQVMTYRTSKEPTGIRRWNAVFGERNEGEVIVASIGEVNPSEGGLEEYLHLSGFETVGEWQEATGMADDDGVVEGRLYLVIEVGQEGDE